MEDILNQKHSRHIFFYCYDTVQYFSLNNSKKFLAFIIYI